MRCLLVAAVLGASACGGTSSETPWPVEPDEALVGPPGEAPGPAPAAAPPNEAPEETDAGAPRQKKAAEPER
jgi:hypothetical protein